MKFPTFSLCILLLLSSPAFAWESGSRNRGFGDPYEFSGPGSSLPGRWIWSRDLPEFDGKTSLTQDFQSFTGHLASQAGALKLPGCISKPAVQALKPGKWLKKPKKEKHNGKSPRRSQPSGDSTPVHSVPDSGGTMLLLGVAMLGLWGLTRSRRLGH